MHFFYKIFIKDIKFLKLLTVRVKKNLIYFFLFIFFFIYMNNIIIPKEKLIIFFLFLLVLLLWKILIEICCYFFVNNDELKVFIRSYENFFNYIIKVLLFIQKWRNPLLLFLWYLDNLLFKILRKLIYIFKVKYNKDLTEFWLDKVFFIYYLILNIILGPLKLILGFYYTALRVIIEISFSFFFIIRIIGFFLSILILSDLLIFIYNKFSFLFFYVFLIIISMIVRYIQRDFIHFKTQYINRFISTDYLIYLRNNSTFTGFFLLIINCYRMDLIERKYINITSSHLKIELEEGFYKYWIYYKRNTWFSTFNAWNEIENRPSYYLYLNLLAWLNVPPVASTHALCAITNIICIKYKVEKLNIPIDLLNDIDYLYVFFLLRLKLLLFMIWDIDNYIGNNINYIVYEYDKRLKYYTIKADYKIYDFIDRANFKVEKNKEDLKFYDPDYNMEFFDLLYMFIGFVPYQENPLEIPVYSEPIFKITKLVEDITLRLIKFNNSNEWYRGWHFNIKKKEEMEMFLIEDNIKDWIVLFLRESKIEWESLLKKETISERNWRLLNEIEYFFLSKK